MRFEAGTCSHWRRGDNTEQHGIHAKRVAISITDIFGYLLGQHPPSFQQLFQHKGVMFVQLTFCVAMHMTYSMILFI
jgi:hypothetical protein